MTVYTDIAIALISVFLMLSLLVTAINEAIANLLKMRGRLLYRILDRLLGGKRSDINSLSAHFFRNPLVICDSAMIHDGNGETPDIANAPPSYMCPKIFARGLIQSVIEFAGEPKTSPSLTIDQFKTSLEKIEHDDLKAILSGFAERAEDNLNTVEGYIEDWFESLMDRVSGIYKRRQMYLTFSIALVVAMSVNLNVIQLVVELYKEDHVISEIELRLESVLDPLDDTQEALANLSAEEANKLWNALAATAVGWSEEVKCQGLFPWLLTILGWLVAALAATLGAPFWFDVLQKVTNIRSAGPKPKPTKGGQS